ncbi:MAG: 2-oxoacid:acceptor oxidoreductase family protein [Desulfamplus sp.]|nr:2-oxoacid:acceptor oxidoreductase family protein [Desulfamplus sp.]MBF0259568.1 2-oxoacid:acceptor oxidoreductase family protein [Desulfamplus sp.]
MDYFNIYLTGVGGQGIGLLCEVLLRAADNAGLNVKAVDTHGLAQRGGIVVSQIRIGDKVYSPLIPSNEADLVISLERHEALRAMNTALKNSGTLIYYNTVWQPLEVRLGSSNEIDEETINQECLRRNIKLIKVIEADLDNVQMQNIALLANICKYGLVPGINIDNYKQAMDDLMEGKMLEENIKTFDRLRM